MGRYMRLNLMRTGLAKGSIYKAFESKHNLYLKSLERYEAIHVDTTVAALSSSKSAIIRLNDFLSAPIKNVSSDGMNKGCFLCNASADRADMDDQTRALVQRGFKKLGRALVSVITELHSDWSNAQTQQAAQMVLSMYSGLRVMSRSGHDVHKYLFTFWHGRYSAGSCLCIIQSSNSKSYKNRRFILCGTRTQHSLQLNSPCRYIDTNVGAYVG